MTAIHDRVDSEVNSHVGSGKDGELYLIDRDNMGHFNGSYATPNSNIVQWIPNAIGGTATTPTATPLSLP